MRKRRVILFVFMLMFGLIPLLNGLSNPRLAAAHPSDFIQLVASGLCIGFGVGVLVGARRFPANERVAFDSILFDFDGVLADTEPIHFDCWREVLADFGIDLPWSRRREFVGVSDRAMLEQLGAARRPPAGIDELWPSYLRKQELFRARIELVRLVSQQTIDLIRLLHQDYKLAVVSSSHRSEVEPPLERAGLRPLFQALVCGREVSNLKPAPDPYLRAAELLVSRRPLVVEDSDVGVASGRAAGFDVLRVSAPETLDREVRKYLKERD